MHRFAIIYFIAEGAGCFTLIAFLYLYVLLPLSVFCFHALTTADSRTEVWPVQLI